MDDFKTPSPLPSPARGEGVSSIDNPRAYPGSGARNDKGGTPFPLIEELADGSFGRIEESVKKDIFKVPSGIDDRQDYNGL